MPYAITWTSLIVLALTSMASAAPIAHQRHALIDGSAVIDGPATAVGALLATADDGTAREGAFMCSAVLIEPTVALTAAHCIALVEADADEEGWQLDWWISFADDVRDFEGSDPTLPPQTVAIRRAETHPLFAIDGPPRSDRLDTAHDIAVLFLAEPAPVSAIPMAGDGIMDDITAETEIRIAGYGFEDPDGNTVPGRRTEGPSRLIEIGAHELRVGRRARMTDRLAPNLAEKCGGDSGGPTFALTDTGWHVIGLTSRGHADDPGCALAGIDTRVDVYADFIDGMRVPKATRGGDGCAMAPAGADWPFALFCLPLVFKRRRRGGTR